MRGEWIYKYQKKKYKKKTKARKIFVKTEQPGRVRCVCLYICEWVNGLFLLPPFKDTNTHTRKQWRTGFKMCVWQWLNSAARNLVGLSNHLWKLYQPFSNNKNPLIKWFATKVFNRYQIYIVLLCRCLEIEMPSWHIAIIASPPLLAKQT